MRSIKDKQAAREDSASTDHLDLTQAFPVSTPNLKFWTETIKRCRPSLVNARPKTAINSQRSDIIASLNDWNQTHRREHADFPAVWCFHWRFGHHDRLCAVLGVLPEYRKHSAIPAIPLRHGIIQRRGLFPDASSRDSGLQ